MLGLKAVLNVVDNSGAVRAELIHVYKVKQARPKSVGVATVGDEVNLVIKRARNIAQTPGAKDIQRPRKGDMRRGVVVRCKKMETRPDGRQIRFDDSAVVLLNAKGDMLGTRITGPVSASLRNTTGGVGTGGKWSKILALAPKIV